MNYAWDIFVKAEEKGIPKDSIKFVMSKRYSAYMELSNEALNFTELDNEVEINPFYRFYDIFKEMFNINDKKDIELRHALLDVALHFLTEIDVMQGMTKIEFYIRFLIDDIINEMFGASIKDGMKLFSKFEKNMIARNMLRLYITGEMLYLLKDTFSKVFKNSIVYANYEVKDELLFYICQEKTRVSEEKVQFLMDIFLPIKFKTRVYWYNHFGIIGSDETMKIDSIALY